MQSTSRTRGRTSSSPAPPDHCMPGAQSQQTMRSKRLGPPQLRAAVAVPRQQVPLAPPALGVVRARHFWAAPATSFVSMWKKVRRTRRKKPSEKCPPPQHRRNLPKRVANDSTDTCNNSMLHSIPPSLVDSINPCVDAGLAVVFDALSKDATEGFSARVLKLKPSRTKPTIRS